MKTTNYILPLAAFAAGALFAKSKSNSSIGAMTEYRIRLREKNIVVDTETNLQRAKKLAMWYSADDTNSIYNTYEVKDENGKTHYAVRNGKKILV